MHTRISNAVFFEGVFIYIPVIIKMLVLLMRCRCCSADHHQKLSSSACPSAYVEVCVPSASDDNEVEQTRKQEYYNGHVAAVKIREKRERNVVTNKNR